MPQTSTRKVSARKTAGRSTRKTGGGTTSSRTAGSRATTSSPRKSTPRSTARTATRAGGRTSTRASGPKRGTQATRRPANKDVITMLKDDHRTVEGLFRRYKKLGDRAEKGRMEIVQRLNQELELHTGLEETIVYPVMRKALARGDEKMKEAVHEHDEADFVLKKLRFGRPLSDGYDEMVEELRQAIDHHVKEEEKELFPQLRKKMDRQQLMDLAKEARAFKSSRKGPRSRR